MLGCLYRTIRNFYSCFCPNQTLQVAPPVDKNTDQEETQNTSNMEVEDIVYNIDYHGATTHPTPTPKHPTP